MNNPVNRTDPSGLDVLGTFTHRQIIEPAFIALHPSFSAEQYFKDSLTGQVVFFDLLDWSRNVFYEIKPWNQSSAGLAQVVQRRRFGFTPGIPVADMWINGPFPGSVVHVWWSNPGLLLYSWLFELPPIIPLPFPAPGREPSRLPRNFTNPAPILSYFNSTSAGQQTLNKAAVLR